MCIYKNCRLWKTSKRNFCLTQRRNIPKYKIDFFVKSNSLISLEKITPPFTQNMNYGTQRMIGKFWKMTICWCHCFWQRQRSDREKHSFQNNSRQALFKCFVFCFWIVNELDLIGSLAPLECSINLASSVGPCIRPFVRL